MGFKFTVFVGYRAKHFHVGKNAEVVGSFLEGIIIMGEVCQIFCPYQFDVTLNVLSI